ncbi:DegT/DnrJ/EryC1/StrS family aminotransferase [Ideonella sp.]|uniref:DegT/DnrJ/EryC1/StrS family aminotransferase n=1 Tax=Ideonella sp. TaxID=1929293 RepID=UPI002B49DC7F|nr:DegT/DnrJ/EryC1/StrS family aminotransferase [Ideonella sp.]HJV70860.1 DegT/DnrJ/EryC1/StrS family aminotransferase [Ideonella sp.]
MIRFLDLQAIYRQDQAAYDAAYRRVMDSGRWILGPELEAFEAEFAAHGGRRHAIGVGNGLDALALALQVAGIGSGDEVLVPAHTFIASWLAVTLAGARPRPVEPAPGSFNIDAAGVAAAITPRTRAVMPVHLYGAPAGPAALRRLCAERHLLLIEDAAQAHGARHQGEAVGGFGRLAAYSFYPGKNLGAFGDAGAVVTDDDTLAAALRARRNYGSARRYQHDSEGVNSRLDELQAAFLRVRLAQLDAHNTQRRAQAARYAERLAGAPGLVLPAVPAGDEPVWHLFVVRHARRDALQAALQAQGIETLIHYPKPVYRFAPFAEMAPAGRTVSDTICDEALSLPIGPHLAPAEIDRVADAVAAFCQQRESTS